MIRAIIDGVKSWWQARSCRHLRRRLVYGDERLHFLARCVDCGKGIR